jgi:ABC-2 type transport system permease protein
MNARNHAIRVGLARGWTEFKQSVTSKQDQGFFLFTAVAVLAYLFFRRNSEVEGTTLLYRQWPCPASSDQ